MTHKQERARVVLQGLFQQLQRLDVEIVGGFIQHQQICRLCKEAGKQEPVALTA